MTSLVIAEHDNGSLNPVTRNAVSAAAKIGGEIHVLVAGSQCAAVADAAAKKERASAGFAAIQALLDT